MAVLDAITPEGDKPGEMIFGLMPEDDSEPKTESLSEGEFREVMAGRYGQTLTQIDNAVAQVDPE